LVNRRKMNPTLAIRFSPPLPCGVLGETGEPCGQDATGGTIVAVEDGRWDLLPICKSCAERMVEGGNLEAAERAA